MSEVPTDDDLIRRAGLLGAIGTFEDAAAEFATERVFWTTLAAAGRPLDLAAPELVASSERLLEDGRERAARAARIRHGPPHTAAERDELARWLGKATHALAAASARMRAAREAAMQGSA